ncbi:ABC transporter substrate-binding protein [Pendulispora brunnea]|uniref:ABC transporter substrate-binding protein n=1 Tax=Pendulispora brunnea TaxID=2905690 RepID=A0ABZ2K139_9BACT
MRYSHALVVAVWAAASVFMGGCREKKTEEAKSGTSTETQTTATTPSRDTILLGHVGATSGGEATYGLSSDNAFKLAVEEQNKKNGIKGKKLELKTLDDQGKPEEAAVTATRLITQDKVTLILGPETSGRSLAVAPIADQNRIPMITQSATSAKVTQDGDKTRPYVFRTCFIDPFQGTVMAKFARENLKVNKVAILRDVGSDYSVGLANSFTAKFTAMGGQIVGDVSFKSGEPDFKAQLTAVRGKNPDAIYVPAYYTEVALIGRQARELGMKQPLMGGDGWDSPKLFEVAKGALDGSFYSNHYSPDDPSPVVQEFITKYKKAYNATPDAFAVLGYDAANLAFAAMERAKDLSGPSIREELENTKSFKGVSGTVHIDEKHNAIKSAVVIGIEKNAPKFNATVEP